MRKKIKITSLLLAAAITICGCSANQSVDEELAPAVSSEWGDAAVDDTAVYSELFEKGTVNDRLYTNERYKFKVMLPDGFTLYDYDSFAERIKEQNNLSEDDYNTQVKSIESDFVYLFTAVSDDVSASTTVEILLTSYNSCRTQFTSEYSQKIYEFYRDMNTEKNETCNVLMENQAVTFGGNQAYRFDGEFLKDGKPFQYMTSIIFRANDYFVHISVYSNVANPDRAVFESELDSIISAVTDTAQ